MTGRLVIYCKQEILSLVIGNEAMLLFGIQAEFTSHVMLDSRINGLQMLLVS